MNNTMHEQAIVREIAAHDPYCCLLPQCEALRTCRLGFPIATQWCCDQDVEVVPSSAFKKERAISVVRCKKEGMLLQPRCKKEGNVVAMNFNQERHTQVSTKF